MKSTVIQIYGNVEQYHPHALSPTFYSSNFPTGRRFKEPLMLYKDEGQNTGLQKVGNIKILKY